MIIPSPGVCHERSLVVLTLLVPLPPVLTSAVIDGEWILEIISWIEVSQSLWSIVCSIEYSNDENYEWKEEEMEEKRKEEGSYESGGPSTTARTGE